MARGLTDVTSPFIVVRFHLAATDADTRASMTARLEVRLDG